MKLTPEQFNKLVTKEDLKELEEKMDKKFDVAFKVFASKEDLRELEERFDEKIDQKIDEVLIAVDGIAKNFENHQIEHVANIGAHDRFEEKFIKTDEKIKVIEEKFEASSVAA